MNFIDWMNLNMLVDISFVVFAAAAVWKIRKIQKEMYHLDEKINNTILNPKITRRTLINQKNKVK